MAAKNQITGDPSHSVIIAWGSSTGYTEEVAVAIHKRLGNLVDTIVDIGDIEVTELLGFDVLILGISTWHIGELQDDWEHCFEELTTLDFTGKKVALFGCGDADGYPANFQDAMGILWQCLEDRGAQLIGLWPNAGYDFLESEALTLDRQHFVGLAIDEHGQDELTQERIERWTRQVLAEITALPVQEELALVG